MEVGPIRLEQKLTLLIPALAISQPALAVDGVIEINQAKALAGGVTATDTPGFPVTIDAAGSYRLTSNLIATGSGSERCVEITASDVTLDLNGFTLRSWVDVVDSDPEISRSTVVNGVLETREPREQHSISLGDAARVDRVRAVGEIHLGSACSLTNSFVAWGRVRVQSGCFVSGNQVTGPVDAEGIYAGSGSNVLNNTIEGFSEAGIYLTGGECVVSGNTVRNISTWGIWADDCVIENNYLQNTNQAGIKGDGSMIKGNVLSDGGVAIEADNAVVIDNVARNNWGVALEANASTGYKGNQFDNNNSGNTNPQVSGGTEIGTNICGGDTTCP
jgi:putative cofactor-binding repeat protein